MKEPKRVTRYYSDCGKGYWNKKECLKHDIRCKCWNNPKFKTCKTCKHGKRVEDSNGMEDEPWHLQTWVEWRCNNPSFIYNKHFTPAHEKASSLCFNCPVWVDIKDLEKVKP